MAKKLKNDTFYVLNLNAYRGGVCRDAGLWTHASPRLNLLTEFVENIVRPWDGLSKSILRIEINKFVQLERNGVHQHRCHWVGGTLGGFIYEPEQSVFFIINQYIADIHYLQIRKETDKTNILISELQEKLKKEFVTLWDHVKEQLNA